MSFASKVLYTGDGVVTDYNVPMPYLAISHIGVYVNTILQLETMHYTWSGASTVSFNSAPGDGDAIEIKRWSSPTESLVDFVDGSVLNASDLDTAHLQNFYLTQEYADSFNEIINNAFLAFAADTGIVSTATADIINELVAQMLEDAAAAELQARITDIDLNAEAIITLGDALQVQINTLAQGVAAAVYIQADEPVPGVGGIPNPIPEGARWYDSDDNNHPYIYQSSAWLDIDDPRIGAIEVDLALLNVEVDDNYALHLTEAVTRANADGAMASDLALIGVANGGDTAFIIDLDTVQITDGVESLAQRFSSITAAWTAADIVAVADADAAAIAYTDAEILTEQTARASATGANASDITALDARVVTTEGVGSANAAQIVTDRGVAASATSAVASDVTTLTARVGVNEDDVSDNAAQIVTEAGVAAGATATVASEVTTLTTTVGGNTSNIATHATTLNGIEAEYGVDLSVNGYIQGFRIINGGTPGENAFVIMADNFAIVDPSGDPGETEYVPFEISGGQINLRSDVKIDGDLMVTGTINGTALINGTIGSTQIGSDSISTTHISANAITATEILAGAITATKINVTNLAAIEADLGSITAGNITLDTSGYIKGGQTAFETGDGFFLGYSGGEYVFSMGDGASNNISWDGTTLTIQGDLVVGEYEVSDNIILSATTERSDSGPFGGWATYKTFTVDKDGDVKLTFESRVTTNTNIDTYAQYQVTVNSVQDANANVTNTSYATKTVSIVGLSAGDVIDINLKGGNSNPTEPTPFSIYVKNAYIKADVIISPGGTVDLD